MTLRTHALDVSMHVRLFSCEITGSEKSPLGCRRINLFCVKEQSITVVNNFEVVVEFFEVIVGGCCSFILL